MCDYSLYSVQNRLAEDGEELVLHRFETSTLGFVSASDLVNWECARKSDSGFWSTMREWLLPRQTRRLPAVCIPPGTLLQLSEVPVDTQAFLSIGSSEIVTFDEISSRSYSYRDALCLSDGTRVLLQDLPAGIHALVLPASPEPVYEPVPARVRAA